MSEDFTSEAGEQNAPELHEEQPTPEYHEIPNAGFNPQKIVVPKKRRDPVFYIALALAAFCILGSFGATAFITGFMAGRSMGQNNGFRGYEAQRMFIVRDRSSFMREGGHHRGQFGAKVAIIQGNNGLQLSQPAVKIPKGNSITWINQTDQAQVILMEKNPALTIAPNQTSILFLRERGGSYTLSLASDPNVTITVDISY